MNKKQNKQKKTSKPKTTKKTNQFLKETDETTEEM
jgi:hypothetical protein